MQFTTEEREFLMKGHGPVEGRGGRVEHADGLRSIEDVDFRGCPPRIFQRILEHRARVLGSTFEEFQRRQAAKAIPVDLDARIAGSRLF